MWGRGRDDREDEPGDGCRAAADGSPPARFEQLRPSDAFFLHAETPGVHQHVGGLAVLDPSSRREGPVRLAEVTARLVPQLGAMPRLRQRLAVPWGGLARAAWVDAGDFDLDRHVRLVRLPCPDHRQLEEAVEAVMSRPLDRSRPLWELVLFDGLEAGRQALLIKLHHAIADGIGALALALRLLDDGTTPPPLEVAPAWVPAPAPAGVDLFLSTLAHQLLSPWQEIFGTTRRAVTDRRRAWRRVTRTVAGVWELARAGSAPPTLLNGKVGPGRRIVLTEVPRQCVQAARAAAGGTENDVVLASVAAALHDWFGAQSTTPPPAELRTMVPVSTRRRQAVEPGSWTATLDIDLPIGPMEPLARLRAVTAATRRAKRSDQSIGSQFVMDAVGVWAAPLLHARFARFAYRGRWFNLIVSTVPGARGPLFLAGARVVTAYPIMPLAEDVGLTVAAMSWNDRLVFGLTADPALVGQLDELAATMVAFIQALAPARPGHSGGAEHG